VLVLPDDVRLEIEEAMRRGHPDEACGLLLGRAARGRVEVVASHAARNAAPAPRSVRYTLDPDDQLAAHEAARARDLEVVGVWHSHPGRPAQPSAEDRTHAWEGWSYLIGSVDAGGTRALRSWRLVAGSFVEEPVASA